MKKLKLEIELEYDDALIHSGEKDKEGKEWFYNDILLKEELILHSNEIGDEVGKVKVLKIKP